MQMRILLMIYSISVISLSACSPSLMRIDAASMQPVPPPPTFMVASSLPKWDKPTISTKGCNYAACFDATNYDKLQKGIAALIKDGKDMRLFYSEQTGTPISY